MTVMNPQKKKSKPDLDEKDDLSKPGLFFIDKKGGLLSSGHS